ncbi:MAG TPA: alcohol dehydrogenase catalytic domain-containing protein [Patescibacteria group bacterium]|nr:alcohol dehydrogenase catalytic domain-containing protein [Patescibacteria group bacterium]
MNALIFDKAKSSWQNSRGFDLADIPEPKLGADDNDKIIIKVRYAGVCGTDRGIWNRQAFRDAILNSIDEQIKNGGNSYRVIGHEFFGEIVEVGNDIKDFKKGDWVACESHVVCNKCLQCLNDQKNVCTNEKILGISLDGGFAEFAKVPGQVAWKVNLDKIRPEVAVLHEPFGNAVHAASKTDLKGKTVAIFGLGPIASFLVVIAKGLGAKTIIGVEPNDKALDMGKKLGVDYVIPLRNTKGMKDENEKPYAHNPEVVEQIMKLTDGLGVDVAFEMAGFNSSVNNAIASVRRGGEVILFGLKNGDFVFEDYNRLVMKGITMHCVAGREIWRTWEIAKKLLEDKTVQDRLFSVLLQGGRGTILNIGDYTRERFEQMMAENPKILIKF